MEPDSALSNWPGGTCAKKPGWPPSMKMSGPNPSWGYGKPVATQCPKLKTVGGEPAAAAVLGIDSASAATLATRVATLACGMSCPLSGRELTGRRNPSLRPGRPDDEPHAGVHQGPSTIRPRCPTPDVRSRWHRHAAEFASSGAEIAVDEIVVGRA